MSSLVTQGKAGCHVVSSVSSYPSLLQKLDAGNQLALIEDLHKDIRIVGNEAKGEHVPGFCIPKKVKDKNEHGFVPATISYLLRELTDVTLQLVEAVTIWAFQSCMLERFCRVLLLLSYPAEDSSCNKIFDSSGLHVSRGRWLRLVGEECWVSVPSFSGLKIP